MTDNNTFEYVWRLVQIDGQPPTDEKIHLNSRQRDYIFYPFPHHGLILTIDYRVWDLPKAGSESSKAPTNIVPWPDAYQLRQFIENKSPSKTPSLIAFTDQLATPIASPLSSKIPMESAKIFQANFAFVGFDVVDLLTSVSGLTSIGYTPKDISRLAALPPKISDHGLIGTINDARIFAEFASVAAPEHAPFFPIEVWCSN